MRLTALLLFGVCLHVSARSYSQTVTLSERNASLQEIFKAIHRQTGYQFFYEDALLDKAGKFSIIVKDAPVDEVLSQCLKGLPITYSIINKTIVVKAREEPQTTVPPVVGADTAHHPTATVDLVGIVQDEKGNPLSGATVAIKGKEKGTVTNEKGYYFIKGAPAGSVLTISFIGYNNSYLTVDPVTRISLVTMKLAVNELDQTVVQAYGTTSQRLTTGNIARVGAEEIEKQPVMNPLLALEGRVAGMVVTQTSGYASGPVKVEIRGRNTINPGFTSDPLYIIDGVPLTVLELGGMSSYQGGSSGFIQNGVFSPAGGQSPFFSLNPADIESIEVLKDADATAIYGSRGANGVILITTKKGKAGKTKFDLSLTQGMSKVTRHWAMLNTTQYLQMRREAFKNDGIAPTIGNAPDLLLWDTTRNVNWQDQLWGGMGQVTNLQTSLSGGDDRTVFRIGAGYTRQTEILTRSGANQRASVSFNLNHHSPDQKFSVALTTNFSYSLINSIFTPLAVLLAPDAPPIYNSSGDLNYAPWNAAGLGYNFPFNTLLQPYTSQTNALSSNLTLSYELVKGLTARVSLGYNNSELHNSGLRTIASQDPAYNPTGWAQFGESRNNNWIIEPQLNYRRFIGEGKLDILLGGSDQSTLTDGSGQLGFGYTNDAFIRSIANAPFVSVGENYGQYKYAALFGRINYNWAGKYILDLNARRDGSSRFGPGRQYGNFGSVGAAWIASEENWVKKALPAAISFIKFRGSYGLTGSDAIGDYQYLSQWATSGSVNGTPLVTYQGITPLVNTHAVDQEYHWQTNKKAELAFDLGFLPDSRLLLELAWYQNRCSDQLLQFPTPVFTGFGNVTANWPADVQNSGLEFLLNAKIIKTPAFSWSASFNIGINRNKLRSYPAIASSPYFSMYKVGQSLNEKYLFHYTGVDPLTGQYSFRDYNHDGNILIDGNVSPGTVDDDRYIAIDLSPKYTGGVGNQFSYKNYGFSFFLSFRKQVGQNAFANNGLPGTMFNQSPEIYNSHWQKPGDKAKFARFTTVGAFSDGAFGGSDGVYTDASFVRLSNLSFSYALPAGAAQKAHLQGCNLYIRAENILVISRYKGIDPETQSFGGMPPARIFTGGLSFNF
ncbi:MAG TPA: SusC/RagA family TonB-linked outer membrane protein [Puia sp.]|uniref:SusC/RagA family TonB-linked outer membrane protein n=1 Tax=Puia sp. TaxID=2045100 RepID=UPI002CD2D045|nr:SusC/RagA family TonB-linked outer membrane protein [Puia sp.]HVU94330.1 SusC/RagA family TonB-linked outer membrane protein [Puia sp.]